MSPTRFSEGGRTITSFTLWASLGLAFFGALGLGANIWAAIAITIAALIVAVVGLLVAVWRWPVVFYGEE